MNDPRRWTDERGEATALERELVGAGRDAGPSREQKRAMWGAIASQAIPPATGPRAAPAVGAAASTGLTAIKGAAILVLLGAGLVASYRTMRGPIPPRTQSSAPATAPAAPPPPDEQPPGVSPPPVGAPAAEGPRSLKVAAHSAPRPNALAAATLVENTRASQLREESAMILGARRVLRARDPAGALTLLDAARTRFADGGLVQEREALTIEALVRSGQRALATKRAEAFLRDYPKSPHGADVRSLVLDP